MNSNAILLITLRFLFFFFFLCCVMGGGGRGEKSIKYIRKSQPELIFQSPLAHQTIHSNSKGNFFALLVELELPEAT